MNAGGLLLFPGAGGDASHHVFAALREGLAPLPTRSVDYPHRQAGRRGPPGRAERLVPFVIEQAEVMSVEMGIAPERLVLGGRSFGGRLCSIAVAQGLEAGGLLLLSYPLHRPGRPGNLRVDHFPLLEVPCLFVSGDRDPFGSPQEFASETSVISGEVSAAWLPGAGHDPREDKDPQIVAAVRGWLMPAAGQGGGRPGCLRG